MKHPARSGVLWGALLLACLLAAACQDQRDPVKPRVSLADPPGAICLVQALA